MRFLLWTILYLLVGFGFSYYMINDMKKWSRTRGSYRGDGPWHLLGVFAMFFWLPFLIAMCVSYVYGYVVGFLYERLKLEIYGADKYLQKTRGYAREVSGHEPITKDVSDIMRWHEAELSKCEYGCKIYQHEKSGVRVLAHNSAYGCKK